LVKKFVPLDCSQEFIPLMDFLEHLDLATNFDPKRNKVGQLENLLWDYQKSSAKSGQITLSSLEREDVRLLKRQVWAGMQMPKRFIPKSLWDEYYSIFNQSPYRPTWDLEAVFIPNPGKKISTWSHHYLKIRELVISNLKKGFEPIFNPDNSKATLKNFGAGTLISVSLIALPYLDSDIAFLGEPPKFEESKRGRLNAGEEHLLDILKELQINPLKVPRKNGDVHYKTKEEAWLLARKITHVFPSKIVFDQCWRRLRRKNQIKYDD
jgi:hypothetical protein